MLPASPSALVVVSASRPARRAAAAVAPKTPQTDVGWKPRAWKAPEAAMPIRDTTSVPAVTAVRTSSPDRPSDSATASAAGTTTTVMWHTESECVSS